MKDDKDAVSGIIRRGSLPGWCLDSKGIDQNTGVKYQPKPTKRSECWGICEKDPEATACEYYEPDNLCAVHTKDVSSSSGEDGKHTCYLLESPVKKTGEEVNYKGCL